MRRITARGSKRRETGGEKGVALPHVLYNHITHTWDLPDPDDGCSDTKHPPDGSPEFSPAFQRAVSRLALGAGTALAAFALWGLLAGVLLGVS